MKKYARGKLENFIFVLFWGKCGMNIAKVYGVELSDTQVKGLLDGKSTSYTSKGKKTIVRPEIVENPYNGKMYYQWKTERDKNG